MKGTPDKLRVLVIDDSEIALQAIASVLESDGIQAFTSESAVGATSAIVKHDVHALVVDMNMPLMSGQKFGTMLRKNDRLAHVKLILVSGEDEAELRRVGSQLGADAVIPKSQIATVLCPTIRRLVGRGTGAATAAWGLRSESATRRKILVADGDRLFAEALAHRLDTMGYDTDVRVLGRGILTAIMESAPALVLVGEKLKDMPGASLVDFIDESIVTRSVPVLYLAGSASAPSPFTTRHGGARETILRTAADDELRARIRQMIGDA